MVAQRVEAWRGWWVNALLFYVSIFLTRQWAESSPVPVLPCHVVWVDPVTWVHCLYLLLRQATEMGIKGSLKTRRDERDSTTRQGEVARILASPEFMPHKEQPFVTDGWFWFLRSNACFRTVDYDIYWLIVRSVCRYKFCLTALSILNKQITFPLHVCFVIRKIHLIIYLSYLLRRANWMLLWVPQRNNTKMLLIFLILNIAVATASSQ